MRVVDAIKKISGLFVREFFPAVFVLISCCLSNPAFSAVGVTDGAGAVNATGAYTYNIAIKVPPGVNGLTPAISLNYSSRNPAKGSPLGHGWSLGGLSEIARIGKTIARDGTRGGVNFDAGDRLSKDGVPLVSSGAGYWSADYYHPVNEDWTKIVPDSRTLTRSFTVYTKDRRILEYGVCAMELTQNLVPVAYGRWYLSRMRDLNGNEAVFDYLSDGEARYIQKITYGYDAEHEIRFEYSTQAEKNWAVGRYGNTARTGAYAYKKRLNAIKIYTGGRLFRQYRLSYTNSLSLNRPMLTKVEDCNGAGSCLDPVVFEWNNPSLNRGTFRKTEPTMAEIGLVPTGGDRRTIGTGSLYYEDRLIMSADPGFSGPVDYGAAIIPGDWNSDGRMDFLRQEVCVKPKWEDLFDEAAVANCCDGSNAAVRDGTTFGFHLSNGDGTFRSRYPTEHDEQRINVGLRQTIGSDDRLDYPGVNIIPGDFNGDGHLDYIRQEKGSWAAADDQNSCQVFLNRGYNAEGFPLFYNPITINERTEDRYLKGIHKVGEDDKQGARIIPGDFNGDAKTDFVVVGIGNWHRFFDGSLANAERIYLSDGDGSFTMTKQPFGSENMGIEDHDKGYHLYTGDFNGDGLTDILRQAFGDWATGGPDTFNVFLSDGDGTFTKAGNTLDKSYLKGRYVDAGNKVRGAVLTLGDYNGDGLTDFIRQVTGVWVTEQAGKTFQVYFSKGNGDFEIKTPSGDVYQKNLIFDNSDDPAESAGIWLYNKYDYPVMDWLSVPNGQKGANLITGDYNGDGRTDFIRQEKKMWCQDNNRSNIQLYLSLGNGSFEVLTPPDESDMQKQLKGLIWYERWLQRKTSEYTSVAAQYWLRAGVNIIPGDYDGDGRTDFIGQKWDAGTNLNGGGHEWSGHDVYTDAPGFSLWFSPTGDLQPDNTIKQVKQGRMIQEITYARLTAEPLRNEPIPSGFRKLLQPLWLAKQIVQRPEKPSASVFAETVTYTYGQPIMGAKSPFLGFTS